MYKIFIYIENNEVFFCLIFIYIGKIYNGVFNYRYLEEIRSFEDEEDDERDNRII